MQFCLQDLDRERATQVPDALRLVVESILALVAKPCSDLGCPSHVIFATRRDMLSAAGVELAHAEVVCTVLVKGINFLTPLPVLHSLDYFLPPHDYNPPSGMTVRDGYSALDMFPMRQPLPCLSEYADTSPGRFVIEVSAVY